MNRRYERNMNALSKEECSILFSSRVCIVGCGGLGGYILEMLGRLGVGHMTAIDGDVFDETNLNRQILSNEAVLGQNKALIAAERMKTVNSNVRVTPVMDFLDHENCSELLAGHDIVIDALDNVSTRRLLAEGCAALGMPLIHGAISGWCAQVTVLPPGSCAFKLLYPSTLDDLKSTQGNPSFTPALAASIEVAEAVKVLCGKDVPLVGKLLSVNMLTNEYQLIELE